MIRKEVTDVLKMLPRVLSIIAMGKLYESWNDEFSWQEASKVFDKLTKKAKDLPWTVLSVEELDALGFGRWSDDTELRLIPAYLYWSIPGDTVVTSISGATCKLLEADTDTRGGSLAFGIIPPTEPGPTEIERGELVTNREEG